jgi:tetratricopeptide (TPR) repeat protein
MIVIVWWVIRAKVIAGAQMFGQEQMIKSFIENLPSMLLYLGKIFLPVNLSVFPLRADANLMWGWVSIGCLAAGAVSSWKQLSFKIVCAGLWMIVFILPCLVLSDLDYEYRLYVPILGALIVVLELWPKKISQRLSVAISIFVVSLFMAMSWRYAGAFQDQWTFWPRAAAEAPHSPLAQRNLGAMYHLKGDLDQAEVYYRKALAINPKEKMVNNNLGLIYQKRGDRNKAIEFYNQEIRNHPEYDLGYYNLSSILVENKNWDDAIILLKKSIELNPLGVDAYNRLIRIYLMQGRIDEARAAVRQLKSIGAEPPDDILQNARMLNVDLTSP